MSCDHYGSELTRYLLGELSEAENDRIEKHLDAGCRRCSDELERIRSVSEELLDLADSGASSTNSDEQRRERVWNHVCEQMAPQLTVTAAGTSARDPETASDRRMWVTFVLAAAAGFLIVSGIRLAVVTSLRIAAPLAGYVGQPENSVAGPEAFPRDLDLRTVSLRRPESPSVECGMIVYDSLEYQLHLYLNGLRPIDSDQRYVLWFRDQSDRVVSKTALEVKDGRVRQLIEVPESRAALRTFVTVESVDFGPEPSGRVAVVSSDQISEDDA